VGEYAVNHPDLGAAAREVLRRVNEGEPVVEGSDRELTALSTELKTQGLECPKDGPLPRKSDAYSEHTYMEADT
jgi:hypothetical protein